MLEAAGVFDIDDLIARAQELAGFTRCAVGEHALTGWSLVGTGFPNGASMAVASLMSHPDLAPTVVAFSGSARSVIARCRSASPVRGCCFRPGSSIRWHQAPASTLEHRAREAGGDVTPLTHSGGHGITQEMRMAASPWITED